MMTPAVELCVSEYTLVAKILHAGQKNPLGRHVFSSGLWKYVSAR